MHIAFARRLWLEVSGGGGTVSFVTTRDEHIPVLLEPVLRLLDPKPGDVVLDCTAGLGGHALALAERVGPDGLTVLLDRDGENLAVAERRLREAGWPVEARHESFVRAAITMRSIGRPANVVLADLGFASNQMDDPERGFSFRHEGPLDMRMDRTSPVTAADLLATLNQQEFADLINRYGEEPLAGRIARKLVQQRQIRPIRTTAELSTLIREAYGPRAKHSRTDPATRTFMALRIAVNDELTALKALLDDIVAAAEHPANGWLARGARIGIISFHSLEDRLVKQCFADIERRELAKRLTRRPITAEIDETAVNPRARSAKLRVVRVNDSLESEPPTPVDR